jgi:hypothetical protein
VIYTLVFLDVGTFFLSLVVDKRPCSLNKSSASRCAALRSRLYIHVHTSEPIYIHDQEHVKLLFTFQYTLNSSNEHVQFFAFLPPFCFVNETRDISG